MKSRTHKKNASFECVFHKYVSWWQKTGLTHLLKAEVLGLLPSGECWLMAVLYRSPFFLCLHGGHPWERTGTHRLPYRYHQSSGWSVGRSSPVEVCAGSHCCCEFMVTIAMTWIEDTIFQHSFPYSRSLMLTGAEAKAWLSAGGIAADSCLLSQFYRYWLLAYLWSVCECIELPLLICGLNCQFPDNTDESCSKEPF